MVVACVLFKVAVLLLLVTRYASSSKLDSHLTVTDSSGTICPPWFVLNETSSECECGSNLGGIVECVDDKYPQKNAIMDCYCMTRDEKYGTIVGSCCYNCENHYDMKRYGSDKLYSNLPLNITLLDEVMCGNSGRAGRLCGKCKDGHHLAAYSYNMKCMKCPLSSAIHNWMAYICVAFIPLTFFFLFVLVFRINVTSPKLMSYVLLVQTLATPANIRIVLLALQHYPLSLYTSKVVFTIYGIWNLDFFRTLLPPICLNINSLQVLALDYVIAIYPLVLVMLTYMLIQLYAHGCLLLNVLWMPCRNCYNHFQQKVDAKTSIIDVFASFIVLSYVKFLCITFDLLIPTAAYNVHGERVGLFLYYDASIVYFGPTHLPYGILSLVVIFFFVLLPLLLLLLYPLRTFQRFCGSSQALRIFIDSFQGSYKDGVVEGRHDCRYFSAVFFIIRIVFYLTYAFTLTGYYYAVTLIFLLVCMLVIAVAKPYRKVHAHYVTGDVVFLTLLVLWHSSAVAIMIASVKAVKSTVIFSVCMCGVVGTLPSLYIPFLLLKKLWSSPLLRKSLHSVFSTRSYFSGYLLRDVEDMRDVPEREDNQVLLQSSEYHDYGSI